jgi:hypothetical protein
VHQSCGGALYSTAAHVITVLYMAARCEVCQNDNFERDPGRAAADEMGLCLTCKGSVVKHLRPLITKDNLLTITAHDLRITLKEREPRWLLSKNSASTV